EGNGADHEKQGEQSACAKTKIGYPPDARCKFRSVHFRTPLRLVPAAAHGCPSSSWPPWECGSAEAYGGFMPCGPRIPARKRRQGGTPAGRRPVSRRPEPPAQHPFGVVRSAWQSLGEAPARQEAPPALDLRRQGRKAASTPRPAKGVPPVALRLPPVCF